MLPDFFFLPLPLIFLCLPPESLGMKWGAEEGAFFSFLFSVQTTYYQTSICLLSARCDVLLLYVLWEGQFPVLSLQAALDKATGAQEQARLGLWREAKDSPVGWGGPGQAAALGGQEDTGENVLLAGDHRGGVGQP